MDLKALFDFRFSRVNMKDLFNYLFFWNSIENYILKKIQKTRNLAQLFRSTCRLFQINYEGGFLSVFTVTF